MEPILYPLTGLAVFLFSLRFLTKSIDESIANRITPFLQKIDGSIFTPLCSGIVLTIIFQASSITIITVMALVGRGLLGLRSGLFVMMGATIGTAVKSWVFATETLVFGYFLIIIPSICLLVVRHHFRRQTFELVLSIGFMFLGWNMLVTGAPKLLPPHFIEGLFLEGVGGSDFQSLCVAFVIGFVLTVLVQSSSTVVLLLIGLAHDGQISFILGTAGILGANVGTTITELVVAIEYRARVKKVALAHFIIKACGAVFALLLLNTFLNAVDLIFFGQLKSLSLPYQFSLVHIGFNVINVSVWILASPLLIRILDNLTAEEVARSNLWLSDPVRNLLKQVPDQAWVEIREQWKNLKERVKIAEDQVFEIISSGRYPVKFVDTDEILNHFRSIEEIVLGLLRQEGYHNGDVARILSDFRHLRLIYGDILALKAFLDSVPLSKLRKVSLQVNEQLAAIDQKRDELWNAIFLEEKAKKTGKTQKLVLRNLEHQILQVCGDQKQINPEIVRITYQLSTKILSILQRIISLARHDRYYNRSLNQLEASEPRNDKRPSHK
ncbi:MAG: Na/Pi cotransporter family protein [Oligoflexales bacterium]|nr:Na/Pi cotransporter family protein [Oligoflexales bacterium]